MLIVNFLGACVPLLAALVLRNALPIELRVLKRLDGISKRNVTVRGHQVTSPPNYVPLDKQRRPATRSQHFACTIRLEAAVRDLLLVGSSPAFPGSFKRAPPHSSPRLQPG